jgi:hypothetical protein
VRSDNLRSGHSTRCKNCGIRKAKREIQVNETVNGWLILAIHDDQVEARCSALHVSKLSERSLRGESSCPECDLVARATKLIGEKLGTYVVISVTDGRDVKGRAIMCLKCEVCAATITRSTQQIFVAREHKSPMKCVTCAALKLAAAVASPLVLDAETCKAIIASARRVVFSLLSSELAGQKVDDIVAETMLQLCSKGSGVDVKDIKHLSNAIANRITKRVFRELKAAYKFVEPFTSDDGVIPDVFDDLNTDHPESTPDEENVQRRAALNSLSPDEQEWLSEFIKPRSGTRSAVHVAKYETLCNKVRAVMLENLTGEDGAIGA